MKRSSIYFDNAATSHPKPEAVYLASDRFLRQGGSPGRAAHELALEASKMVFETRLKLSEFLCIKEPERLIFTPGCTQSINMVLSGIGLKQGDLVLVSALEHNALMRPLEKLKSTIGIELEQLPYSPGEIFAPEELERSIKGRKPRLCAFMEASNVTGEVLDLCTVAAICRKYGVELLVDAAQSAGIVPTDLNALGLSYWCASGHKGLFGIAGLGLLYVNPAAKLEPLIFGGTGSHSEELQMPANYPDRLEAGTMPGPAIAGLGAGVEFLQALGAEKLAAHEMNLSRRFSEWLTQRKEFKLLSPNAARCTATVSFTMENMDAARVAELLDRNYSICVRAGHHCASSAHRALGTLETGAVRVSFGYFNSEDELETLLRALEDIACIACK